MVPNINILKRNWKIELVSKEPMAFINYIAVCPKRLEQKHKLKPLRKTLPLTESIRITKRSSPAQKLEVFRASKILDILGLDLDEQSSGCFSFSNTFKMTSGKG